MIPRFERPRYTCVLYGVAVLGWVMAGCVLFDAVLDTSIFPGENSGPRQIGPVLIRIIACSVAGFVFFGLAQILESTARVAHYAKHICWEQLVANRLFEKNMKEARPKAASPKQRSLSRIRREPVQLVEPVAEEISEPSEPVVPILGPMERVFRRFDEYVSRLRR